MNLVRHLTSKSIWALGHGLIIWAEGPTSALLRIPPQALKWRYDRACVYRGAGSLLRWEPFPKPLIPKHPLKFINIGPLFALVKKIMMIPPLTMGYK